MCLWTGWSMLPVSKAVFKWRIFWWQKNFPVRTFSLTSRNSKVTYFIAYRSWWSRKTSNDCFTVVKWHFPYELLWNFRGSCYDNTWWLFGGQPRQCIWIKKESPVQPLFGLVTQQGNRVLHDKTKQQLLRRLQDAWYWCTLIFLFRPVAIDN